MCTYAGMEVHLHDNITYVDHALSTHPTYVYVRTCVRTIQCNAVHPPMVVN